MQCLMRRDVHVCLADSSLIKPSPYWDDAVLLGIDPHQHNLDTRLSFLSYLYRNTKYVITYADMQVVWEGVMTYHLSQAQLDTGFRWFQTLQVYTDAELVDSIVEPMFEHLTNMPLSWMSYEGFACFRYYFIVVNLTHELLTCHYEEHEAARDDDATLGTSPPFMIISASPLHGVDHLWRICLHVEDEEVAEEACMLLIEIHHAVALNNPVEVLQMR